MQATDFLPPIVSRGLRAIKHKLRPSTHVQALGRRFHHRGSGADLGVIHQVFGSRDYDLSKLIRYPEILRFYDACSRPLIIDAGANIGASPVWFAHHYPKATIAAIEPHPGNFALLERNVTGLKVKGIQGAVAAKSGRLRLFDPGMGEWGFRTGEAAGRDLGEVPALTIAELVQPGDEPFILKIDIEGAEAGLFDDDVFSRFPVLIIELHDWMLPKSASSRSFLRWQGSQDRDFVHLGENDISICNHLIQ